MSLEDFLKEPTPEERRISLIVDQIILISTGSDILRKILLGDFCDDLSKKMNLNEQLSKEEIGESLSFLLTLAEAKRKELQRKKFSKFCSYDFDPAVV